MGFEVVYEDAGEGWIYAHVPELPEVHTQGENLEAARAMANEAIELVLDEGRGGPPPKPSRAVRREAQAAGGAPRRLPCTRTASNHELWVNDQTGRRATVPRHDDIRRATVLGICEQLGIPPPAPSQSQQR
jgi:predicted RNase H-like HicB family nuclease